MRFAGSRFVRGGAEQPKNDTPPLEVSELRRGVWEVLIFSAAGLT